MCFFSIVVPTYNRAKELQRCLQSLCDQTYKEFEVLVCDDGSSDETSRVVEGFEERLKIRYFRQPNWGGPARPRNVGINNARGDWVCFLDSDDWWYPFKLEKCMNFVNGEYDIICHNVDIKPGNRNRKVIKTSSFRRGNTFKSLMIEGNSIAMSSVCVKKNIFEELGGFSEDRRLIAVEDFDMWLRIARAGFKFKVINEILGAYWMGGGNISGFSNRQKRKLKTLYNIHLPYLNDDRHTKRLALGMLNYSLGKICHVMSAYRSASEYYMGSIETAKLSVKLKAAFFCILALLDLEIFVKEKEK